MPFSVPRIVIAALKGGSGKTLISLGLAAAWKDRGLRVSPFKKGPDFIDAGWLGFATGRSCRNLDSFLMTESQILESFVLHSRACDISLVEGNRGLFDGMDVEGSCSTAELAKLLGAPVIIVIDVTMATRTVAAVVKGCQVFDRDLNVAGVILNRVAGKRQEKLIGDVIGKYCGIKVVGTVPKLKENFFPERHMGLVPYQERGHAEKAVSWAKDTVVKGLDLEEILKISRCVGEIGEEIRNDEKNEAPILVKPKRLNIGYILDKSFWFYYPENLEQLERAGADLIKIDAMSEKELPSLDALYIGGGFPECHAHILAENRTFRKSLRENIEKGLPVYAECGGLIYMGTSLILDDKKYPMVGALPIEFKLGKKPQGHGYTVLKVDRPNKYFSMGEVLVGHEFHYSKATISDHDGLFFAFKVERGHGVDGIRDGICRKNLLATYTHLHSGGNPDWAMSFMRVASEFKKENLKNYKRTIDNMRNLK